MSGADAAKLPVRAVVLCCEGLFQRYLAVRVSEQMELAGLVVQRAEPPASGFGRRIAKLDNPFKLSRHLLGRWAIRTEQAAARDLLAPVAAAADRIRLDCPQLTVENINDPRTVGLLDELRPDAVLVNGTRLIRPPLLDKARDLPLGMINLHTGLSPYARGGNCNLHVLREGRPELVGVTIHHIDPGIDSGDLILTARPKLDEDDTFERIETKVFLLGIALMIRALRLLHEGRAPRVAQWTEGKEFLRRTGYVYEPWQRFEVRRILKRGLIGDYLSDRATRDKDVHTVRGDGNA